MRHGEWVASRKVRAVLEQVGPVCLERVARQPALELEVREEVEHEVLERLGGSGERFGDGHRLERSPESRRPLCGATSRPRAGAARPRRRGGGRVRGHRSRARDNSATWTLTIASYCGAPEATPRRSGSSTVATWTGCSRTSLVASTTARRSRTWRRRASPRR